MKLAFYKRFSGLTFKEVPFEINILTLKNVCKAFEVDFNGIDKIRKTEPHEFMVEFLYQGYVSACKEQYKKPKYDRLKAYVWAEHMSETTRTEFAKIVADFYDEWGPKKENKKKVKTQQHGESLTDSQSES